MTVSTLQSTIRSDKNRVTENGPSATPVKETVSTAAAVLTPSASATSATPERFVDGFALKGEHGPVSAHPTKVYLYGGPEQEKAKHLSFAREHAAIQVAIAQAQGISPQRGQHAAAIAAAKVEMQVYDSVPKQARHGVFAHGRHFEGVARFSPSGSTLPGPAGDSEPGVRGLALKLDLGHGHSQDFLLTNMNAFFGSSEEVMTFVRAGVVKGQAMQEATAKAKAEGKDLSKPEVQAEIRDAGAKAQFGFLANALGEDRTKMLLGRIKEQFSKKVTSLANETFFTTMPIKVGHTVARMRLRPVNPDDQTHTLPGKLLDPATYLRDDLKARGNGEGVTYEMGLQFYVDERKTPINDQTFAWKEEDAPVVWVSRVKIPGQGKGVLEGAAADAVNKAEFSVANTKDHSADVSEIGRARMVIYKESAKTRGSCPYGFN